MRRRDVVSRWAAGGALVVVLGLGLAVGAQAQDKGPNTGRISLSAGIDWTTDYYFRGIRQETSDWIFQPHAEVSLKLYEDPGPLSAVTLTAGLWNSLHGGKTGDEGQGADPQAWYEADFYARGRSR